MIEIKTLSLFQGNPQNKIRLLLIYQSIIQEHPVISTFISIISEIPVWDGMHLDFQHDDIVFIKPDEPWRNVAKTTRIVRTSIMGIQKTLPRKMKTY